MGLDAIVPCNCFEKGKLSDPPEPFAADDLYRDADGFISSRKLDAELERLGSRAFQNCCGYLEDLLEDWSNNACEHEYGEYFSERVGAWTSVHTFNYIVERLGGSERYPILSTLLPQANGGSFPASRAPQALREIDDFLKVLGNIKLNALVCSDSDEPVKLCADHKTARIIAGPHIEVGLEGDCAYFATSEHRLTSKRFHQDPAGPMSIMGEMPMDVILSESGERIRVFDSIGPQDAPKVAREFWIEKRELPIMHDGHYYTAERIRSLLVASIEMGTPICWC